MYIAGKKNKEGKKFAAVEKKFILCRINTPRINISIIFLFHLGYVGADLSSLVRESAIAAINRVFKNIQGNQEQTLSDLLG